MFANLNKDRAEKYKIDAGHIEEIQLYHDILREIDRIATIKIFNQSKTIDDILAGKTILYTTDLIRKKIFYFKIGDTKRAIIEGRQAQ